MAKDSFLRSVVIADAVAMAAAGEKLVPCLVRVAKSDAVMLSPKKLAGAENGVPSSSRNGN